MFLLECWSTNFFKWQDGFFKIRRGTNECGIEGDVVAGLPSTRNLVREVVSVDAREDASAWYQTNYYISKCCNLCINIGVLWLEMGFRCMHGMKPGTCIHVNCYLSWNLLILVEICYLCENQTVRRYCIIWYLLIT